MLGKLKRRDLKSYIINPTFQLGFIGWVCFLAVVNFVVVLGAVQYTFWAFIKRGTELQMPENSAYFKFIGNQHDTMNMVIAGVGLFNICLLILGGIVLSHRVAGPLYRLNKHMSDVAEGKTTSTVKFRKKDFFLELAESYNRQLNHLVSGSHASPKNGDKPENHTKHKVG